MITCHNLHRPSLAKPCMHSTPSACHLITDRQWRQKLTATADQTVTKCWCSTGTFCMGCQPWRFKAAVFEVYFGADKDTCRAQQLSFRKSLRHGIMKHTKFILYWENGWGTARASHLPPGQAVPWSCRTIRQEHMRAQVSWAK